VLCGIGFTMSLFIGDLAFRQTPRGDEVQLAVFVGSLSSAVLGLAILAFVSRTPRGTARPAEAAELARAIPP
jgi:NhaA family Na+:H+ antiporter